MSSEKREIIVQAGQAFHCPNDHYVCRAAIDISNEPNQTVSKQHFTDWAPDVVHDTGKIPLCPKCGLPWLVFSRGDA